MSLDNAYKYFVILLFYSIAMPCSFAITLSDVVRMGLHQADEVKIKQLERDDAATTKKLAPLAFIPTINVSASFATMPTQTKYTSLGALGGGGEDGIGGAPGGGGAPLGPGAVGVWLPAQNSQQNVLVSQNLTLYKMIPELRAASYAADAKYSEYKEFLEQMTTDIISLYFNLMQAQKNVQLSDMMVKINNKKLASASAYGKNKLISRLELAKVEAQYAEALAGKTQASAELAKLQADYRRQIGSADENLELPPDAFMKLPKQKFEDFLTTVMARNNQVIKTVNLRKREYQNKLAAHAALLPDLKLNFQFLNANRVPPILFSYMMVSLMFEVSWQIFDGGKAISRTLSSDKNHRMAIIRENMLRKKLEAEANRAWLMYYSFDDLITARQKTVFAAQQDVQRLKESFSSKSASEVDLLSGQAELLRNEINLIKTKSDKVKAYYYIMSLIDVNPFLTNNHGRNYVQSNASLAKDNI